MPLTRPNEPYHFQANLIWWDSPFKCLIWEKNYSIVPQDQGSQNLTLKVEILDLWFLKVKTCHLVDLTLKLFLNTAETFEFEFVAHSVFTPNTGENWFTSS